MIWEVQEFYDRYHVIRMLDDVEISKKLNGCGQLLLNVGSFLYQQHLQHPQDNSPNGLYYTYLRIAETHRTIFTSINPHWWH